jgi:hypothetical protein
MDLSIDRPITFEIKRIAGTVHEAIFFFTEGADIKTAELRTSVVVTRRLPDSRERILDTCYKFIVLNKTCA